MAIRIGKLWMIPEEVRRLLGGKQEDIAVLYAKGFKQGSGQVS